jgi:hypothetical protein
MLYSRCPDLAKHTVELKVVVRIKAKLVRYIGAIANCVRASPRATLQKAARHHNESGKPKRGNNEQR